MTIVIDSQIRVNTMHVYMSILLLNYFVSKLMLITLSHKYVNKYIIMSGE